ncbi:MAG TPA: cation:proton antiporter [Terriglobales bacterium]|nr:cation:proton antiporter [Terriglobales bacterium]
MSEHEIGSLTLVLLLILGLAHLLGWLFVRLRQPRVVGEILAGVLLGPSLLGHFAPGLFARLFETGTPAGAKYQVVVGFVYNLGLLLLMFLSGAETRQLFSREERKEVGWLVSVGTGTPFLLGLAIAPFLALDALSGPNGNRWSVVLVLAIAVAVTSIPVISRIFADLKILGTRFARLVLGVAVIEDIVLWAALGVATALAGQAALDALGMGAHVAKTLAFFLLGLTVAPRLVKRFNKARFNVFASNSPVGYVMAVLLAYCAVAGALGVSLVFAAFLAGFAVVHKKRRLFAESLEAIGKFSFAVFIPIYFAIVGWRLDLSKSFAFGMLALFLVGSCVLKLVSVAAGARLAGFRGLDIVNLAVATNARGGPGIVLASVAYDAGIINAAFYTTLVLSAVLTSQAAGAWLEYVLRKGWPLLKDEKVEAAPAAVPAPEIAA